MTEWFLSIEGTSSGRTVAFVLAIMAAILHAVLGAMQKGKFDPWTSRAFIDINYCLLSLPFALFVFPLPEPEVWRVLCFGVMAHAIYKILMAMAFSRAAFTVVYPVVRGTGPLVTVLFAGVVFNEIFTLQQWIGITVLSTGIFGLALYNLWKIQGPREQLPLALIIALVTGVTVAIYTTVDAYGVRLSASPFSYLAWLFVLDGFIMPIIWLGWKRKPEHIKALPQLVGSWLHWWIICSWQFWFHHVGNKIGSSRKSCCSTRNINSICSLDWMDFIEGNSGSQKICIDFHDRHWRHNRRVWNLDLAGFHHYSYL